MVYRLLPGNRDERDSARSTHTYVRGITNSPDSFSYPSLRLRRGKVKMMKGRPSKPRPPFPTVTSLHSARDVATIERHQIIFVVQLTLVMQEGSKPPTSTVAVMLSKPSAPVVVASISLVC